MVNVAREGLHIHESFAVKRGLNASAKSVDSNQLTHSARTDPGRKVLSIFLI